VIEEMFTPIQILLLILVSFVVNYDVIQIQCFAKCGAITLIGFLTGIILGDVTQGLLIGGTMELMSLGLAGFGGASVPNYRVGCAVGAAYAIATGGGLDVALLVGVPTATLGVQFDVLAKMAGSFWLHLSEKAAAQGNYKKCYNIILFGNIFGSRVALAAVYPVAICLIFGSSIIDWILEVIPAWFTSSFTIVGNVLPALGMAILMKYLPLKGNFQFLILGFVLSVYLGLDIMPIALIGVVIAMMIYYNLQKTSASGGGNTTGQGGIGDE